MRGTRVIVTYNCNMMCGCCEYKCGPNKKGIMEVKDFENYIFRGCQDGYGQYITIEGGEPFMYPSNLYKYLKSISKIKADKQVITNGYWGRIEPYIDIIYDLKKYDLNRIIFEYDFFHSVFIDVDVIKEAIDKASRCGIHISLKSFFNTKNLSSKEDNHTFEYIKDIKNDFKDIKLIFANVNTQSPPFPHLNNPNEKLFLYRDG